MIVSASRRTDIPAFYSEWFMNRVRAGFCDVPQPFNSERVTHVDLRPENVSALVFWTRHAAPLFPHLDELDARGFRYYFLYTLIGYPPAVEPHAPSLSFAIDTFRSLADRVGPERVVWRYDPIVLSKATDVPFHLDNFGRIASKLAGSTRCCIISFVNHYRKTEARLRTLPFELRPIVRPDESAVRLLVPGMVRVVREHGLTMQSCAEEIDLRPYGVPAGKCIDDALIERLFGIEVAKRKDPGQRKSCGCVASRDIGAYDTCVMGCLYCYATGRHEVARRRYVAHDQHATSLVSSRTSDPR